MNEYINQKYPDEIVFNPNLSSSEKICVLLLRNWQISGSVVPTVDILAECMGMSDRSVSRIIKDLIKKDVLDVIDNGPGKPRNYILKI